MTVLRNSDMPHLAAIDVAGGAGLTQQPVTTARHAQSVVNTMMKSLVVTPVSASFKKDRRSSRDQELLPSKEVRDDHSGD